MSTVKPYIRTSVLFDQKTYRALSKKARENDRSLMAEIRVAVKAHLNGKDGPR